MFDLWSIYVLLVIHLLFAHLATGGPLIAIVLDWSGNRADSIQQLSDGRMLARSSLVALLAAAIAGIALGFVRFYAGANYQAVWNAFHERIWWGLTEYLISVAILVVYTVMYPRLPGRNRLASAAHRLLAIVATTSLLYHFPPLFAAIAAASREISSDAITTESLRASVLSISGLARSVHFSFAAFFVAGLWTMAKSTTREASLWGTRIAVWSLVLQWPVGFWLLTTLPAVEMRRIMGASPLHLALLIGGLMASVLALFQLLELSADVTNPRLRLRAGVTSLCLLLTMIALLV